MQIKTRGIVLKQRNLGENDRVITILSDTLGLIEAIARDVKSARSVLAGAVQILGYNDFCLFKGRGGYIVDSAESVASFYDLRLDVEKLSLAGYFCELTSQLCSTDDQHAPQFLKLILNTLHFLQEGTREAALLKCLFELRAMSIAGFMPNLICCSVCAEYEHEHMIFLPLEGILVCASCYKGGDTARFDLTPDVLAAMRFIVFSEFNRLFLFRVTGDSLTLLGEITESYTAIHTEGSFKSLEMYKAFCQMQP